MEGRMSSRFKDVDLAIKTNNYIKTQCIGFLLGITKSTVDNFSTFHYIRIVYDRTAEVILDV